MNTQDTTREILASNEELALRLAELELRVAVHDEILNFLKTILDQPERQMVAVRDQLKSKHLTQPSMLV